MKILHTSDWHLGKRLGTFSRLPEQREVINEILDICGREEPDLILVAGDLFDAFNPPNEAVELLYSGLKRLTRGGSCPVIALAGNHDSPERIEAPDPLARECGIFFLGYPDSLAESLVLESGVTAIFPAAGILELNIPGVSFPVRIIYAPYANESRLRRYLGNSDREEALRNILQERWLKLAESVCDEKGVNLFTGHFFISRRGELFQEEPEGERPILYPGGLELIYTDNLPPGIQYAALGHLHRPQEVALDPFPVCYSGSPLAYSLSEAEQDKKVVLIDAEPGNRAAINFLPLKSGRRILRRTFSSPGEVKSWLSRNMDCFVEITLKTDDYISSGVKREFHEIHDGILALIPLVNKSGEDGGSGRHVDLGRSVEELFIDYFREQNRGTPPGEELLALFKEITDREAGQ